MNQVAVMIAQDLNLNMARPTDVLLEEESSTGKGALSFAPSGSECFFELRRAADNANARPAASSRGLNKDRKAELREIALRCRGYHGNVSLSGDLTGFGLGAHRADHARRRSNEGNAGFLAGSGKIRILSQEAVARMDRVNAAALGRGNDRPNIKVGIACRRWSDRNCHVRLADVEGVAVEARIDRRDFHATPSAAPHHPPAHFAAVF